MGVETWVWVATLVGLLGVLVVDLMFVARRPHDPSMRESAIWVAIYVGLALLFGLGIWYFSGRGYAGQFYVGWLTEYSLSVDNLFVFVIIMARFAVPRQYQQKVLLIGIVLALVMRGAFIAAGCGDHQPVRLGLLHLRRVPALHRDQAGQARRDRPERLQGERARSG